MSLLLRGGRVLDPAGSVDRTADLLVEDGRIARVEPGLDAPAGCRVIEVAGRIVAPGLIDPHVHLREPGQEHKEDLETGTRAAAAGGFTTVCCMPNTKPVNDCRAVTESIVRRAREVGAARVCPIGAITKGSAGEVLADFDEMRAAGAVAFSDDGRCVMNAAVMRRALERARALGLPVSQHCQDEHLARQAVAHESAVAARAGLVGEPAAAESVIVARDLELVELTGARYHVAHVSAAASVRLVRDAKRRGLPVTAEVTPHHLTLTDEAIASGDTSTRVNPPLRGADDRDALWEGLADGTLDCIATDHAPHSPAEKEGGLGAAAPGLVGLETALALGLRLVAAGVLPLARLIAAMTVAPAGAFGLPGGTLAPGAPADVVVIDPDRLWTVTPAALHSKSKNTPFAGWELRGKAVLTLCGGTLTHEEA
ncbi:MAG: dihydroorotase [Deltaproteobacteria bacterium]|nr:dihydroorotase [Deltaproteobacteria bacterium]